MYPKSSKNIKNLLQKNFFSVTEKSLLYYRETSKAFKMSSKIQRNFFKFYINSKHEL